MDTVRHARRGDAPRHRVVSRPPGGACHLSATTPAVSVVVSTFNRAHLVPRLVAALAAQDFARPYEVVIVDNGSSDGTREILERLAATTPIDMKVLDIERNNGPAPARNLGWRAASAPLVAFTDDDCVPQAGWLTALAGALDRVDLAQ